MRRIILSLAIIAIASPAGGGLAAAQSDEGSFPEAESIPPDDIAPDDIAPAEEPVPIDEGDETLYDDPAYDEPAYEEPAYDEAAYDDTATEPLYEASDPSYVDDSTIAAETDVDAVETFREVLSPYGRWVRTAEFGVVWVPSRSIVGSDFVPYGTGGSWRYSTAGWLFASDWDWGWAPFHYGRWYRQHPYGWVWVPGTVWAPAWVDWRFGDGYIGWAPLPPRGYRVSRRDHRNWYFCSYGNMGRPHIQRYWVRSNPRLWRRTVAARNPVRHGRARWYRGPRLEHIERGSRSRVHRVHVAPPRAGVVGRLRIQGNRSRIERVATARRHQADRQRRFERDRQERFDRQRRDQVERQRFERQRHEQAERQRRNQENDRRRQEQVERQRRDQVERQRFERQRHEQRQQAERQRHEQRQQAERQQRFERQRRNQVEQQQRFERQRRNQVEQQQRFERQRNQQMQRQREERFDRQRQQVEPRREQQVERRQARQQQAERRPRFDRGRDSRPARSERGRDRHR